MTTYYEVLRPVEQADLDTSPTLADVLRVIPTSAKRNGINSGPI